jgi:hypothetical protein
MRYSFVFVLLLTGCGSSTPEEAAGRSVPEQEADGVLTEERATALVVEPPTEPGGGQAQAPEVPPMVVPYINQFSPGGSPYSNGSSNCGPTSAAMIARALHYRDDLSNAGLIMHLGKLAGTTAAGTAPMAEELVVRHLITETKAPLDESTLRAFKPSAAWLHARLAEGKALIAHVKIDGVGHYIVVRGETTSGNLLIHDPARRNLTALSKAQFLSYNAARGTVFAIGNGSPVSTPPPPPGGTTFDPSQKCTGRDVGLYCGGNGVAGDATTLYRCGPTGTAVEQRCLGQCVRRAQGQSDACQ